MTNAACRTARARFEEAMRLNDLALRMKDRGWHVDQKAVDAHGLRLTDEIKEAKEGFQRASGLAVFPDFPVEGTEDDDAFDEGIFGSAPQLKELFFNRWQVTPKYKSKATGQPSLNKNALQDLLAEGKTEQIRTSSRWLLRFREAHKTKATYIDRLKPESRTKGKFKGRGDKRKWHDGEPNTLLTVGYPEDGYILRPTWNVVQALTARWSSSDPNLQNLQKPRINPQTKLIERRGTRDVLVSRPMMWLIEGDYSQLELRIIALLAGDEILLGMYADPTIDMHAENAKILFNLKEYDPKAHKGLRDLAKIFVYGANYGAHFKTLWKQIVVQFPKVTEAEVARMQERWFKIHPWLKAWSSGAYRLAKETGMVVEYLSGREFVFYLRQVKATEPANYLVQGFAAAIMNAATLRVDARLRWEEGEAMLAQVHDAAFLEGPNPLRLGRILQKEMPSRITIGKHSMDFLVDLKIGNCWGRMIDWNAAKFWLEAGLTPEQMERVCA